jgi:hypothetical protein
MALPRDSIGANLSAGSNKLCLLAGLTAGLAYSIFASFIANALTPVAGRLYGADSLRHAVAGHYQEVFSLDGVVPILVASMIVFVIVWWSARVILDRWQPEDWTRIGVRDRSLSAGTLLTAEMVPPLTSTVSK